VSVRRAIVGVLFVALCVGAVVVARRTSPAQIDAASNRVASDAQVTPRSAAQLPVLSRSPAPSLEAATGWINTGPLTPAVLAGQVVLYDFWTFECINCQHTFSHVEAWHERYAKDGLVVVGVHTPEFDEEAVPANVERAVRSNGLTYPIALDPQRTIWRAFANHYWPAFYLYDRAGSWRYQHAGEGSYAETEDAIRVLLGVDPASPRASVAG
jgi:thiol-disulfide isomerase/thioredoxin